MTACAISQVLLQKFINYKSKKEWTHKRNIEFFVVIIKQVKRNQSYGCSFLFSFTEWISVFFTG